MEAIALNGTETAYPAEWYRWRPFVGRALLVIPKSYKGRQYACIIDPWTQHWVVAEPYVAELARHLDGKTSAAEAASRAASNQDVEQPCDGYAAVFDGLLQNGLLYENALHHRRSGHPVYNKTELTGFHLEITNACNMSCEHCYVSSGKRLPDELKLEQFKAAIDMLEPFSGKRIAISGGEPVASRDCLAIVEYCAMTCGHDVDLYTNGKRFPKRIAERIVEINRMGLGTVRLQLSLEGATAEVNDRVRGKGSFDHAMETLAYFESLGLNRKLVIFVCLTAFNIHHVDALIRLAERFDVEMLVFSQWQRQGNAKDTPWAEIAPSTAQWVEVGEKIARYHNPRMKIYGNFYGDLNNNEIGRFSLDGPIFPKHLYAYNAFPRITPEGNILADQLWVDPDWFLGNVVRDDLDACFDSPKFHQQLADMRARVAHIPECQACTWRDLCMGGSPGHTYAEYGHMNEKDLFCDSRKYWFERYLDHNFRVRMEAAEAG